MPDLLKGKVAAVTGGGRGLGRAHALALAKQGAKLVINDLGGGADGKGAANGPAKDVADEIVKMGGQAVPNFASVSTPDGAASIIKTAVDAFGRIDIMVNNAGVLRDRIIFNMTDDEWDLVIKVHLYGTFYCTKAACMVMKEQNYGRIINTSSLAGLGQLGQVNYAAAKEGIVGLTRTVAKDMARYHVTCNAIRPAAATRMTVTDELYQQRVKTLGAEKAVEWKKNMEASAPEDVSPLIVYLASEQAGPVTGCVFEVRDDFIGLYDDPPRISKTILKGGETWTPEELVEFLPKTLTANIEQPPQIGWRRLSLDAKGWQVIKGKLSETTPSIK